MQHIASSLTLVAFFTTAPTSVIPLLNTNARLDMVDYYEAGMSARAENRYGGESVLTELSDTLISLRTTESTTLELRMPSDSVIQLTEVSHLPEGDFRQVKYYTSAWEKIK